MQVVIGPDGSLLWLSRAFGGSASDEKIVSSSGWLEGLVDGDVVMADKGFRIEGILNALPGNIGLVLPHFVYNGELAAEEVTRSMDISRLRYGK